MRRAFAVAFLTAHPGTIEALQALMSHSRIDITQVYLRRSIDRRRWSRRRTRDSNPCYRRERGRLPPPVQGLCEAVTPHGPILGRSARRMSSATACSCIKKRWPRESGANV
jgi:hypothetical protein